VALFSCTVRDEPVVTKGIDDASLGDHVRIVDGDVILSRGHPVSRPFPES
jgi:hypothetical protein